MDQDNIGQLSSLVTHSEISIQTQHEQLPKTHLCLCYNILPASVAAQGKLEELSLCVCVCVCVCVCESVGLWRGNWLHVCLIVYVFIRWGGELPPNLTCVPKCLCLQGGENYHAFFRETHPQRQRHWGRIVAEIKADIHMLRCYYLSNYWMASPSTLMSAFYH